MHCCERHLKGSDPVRPIREINCSLETTGFHARLYAAHHDPLSDIRFYCGDVVRLVDPELNAQVKLEVGLSDCVLAPRDAERVDSGALWVVEAFYKPAVGGPVTYGGHRSFRLRHLNSGRYVLPMLPRRAPRDGPGT